MTSQFREYPRNLVRLAVLSACMLLTNVVPAQVTSTLPVSDSCTCGDGKTVTVGFPMPDGTRQQQTWIANANLAQTCHFGVSNIHPDGSMSWSTAMNWVAAMNTCNYLGRHDWTLPETIEPDKNCTVGGFQYNCTGSPMPYLYHLLGGREGISVSQLTPQVLAAGFRNFQPYLYWSSTPQSPGAYSYSFGNDFYGTTVVEDASYAIPYYPPINPPPPNRLDNPNLPPNRDIGALPVQANPSLVPVAFGLGVYDTVKDITWLSNANLAAFITFGVPGINKDGSMSFETAIAWIAAMNKARFLGHTDWRLPLTPTTDPFCSMQSKFGYDCTDSELGRLFYTQLGGEGGSSIFFTHNANVFRFFNIQPYLYWSCNPLNPTDPNSVCDGSVNGNPTLSFGNGFQGGNVSNNEMYVIPVVPGQLRLF